MAISTIYLGADHAGFALKERLKALLPDRIHIEDLSPVFAPGDDYPTIGSALAHKVAGTRNSRGILVCGSGVGVCIAANRVKKVRAFEARTAAEAKRARHDDDVNVLCLSGWDLTPAAAKKIVDPFLKTAFGKATRYLRRVKQLG